MKKILLPLLFLFFAVSAFAHAGHEHTYLGTVTMLHDDGSFMIQKTDGQSMTVMVSASTAYRHADGSAATRAELTNGRRVAVTMAKDGKAATLVKLGTAEK